MKNIFLLFCTVLICSCNNERNNTSKKVVDANIFGVIENTKVISLKNGVYCGFADSKGILWFGTNGDGLYRYDGTFFTHITEKDGLSNNEVCAITEDKQGNLWFGTAKGVNRYDGDHFTTLAIPQSDTSTIWLDKVYPIVNPNKVMSILQDKKGHFWFGTNGAGVYQYDGKKFTQYLSKLGKVYEDGLQHNIILRIIEDLEGNIWFSSLSHAGVSRYDGKTFTHFVHELSDDFIRTVFCDSKGNIWVGSHGNHNGGLDLFNGKNFTQFHKTNDGFSDNNCKYIYEDKKGKLWIGSGRGPLSIFDGKHFEEFKTKDNQTFSRINFIINDKKGRIWFGGNDGLWKYDGNDVTEMAHTLKK